jgi:hypothetical protein
VSRGLPFLSSRRRSVLSRAEARWRAGNYSSTLDALVDESGNGLHARLGSAVGADSNDPLRLGYAGKYVYFPGIAGNYPSAADSAALSVTSDIDLRGQVALSDFTPASKQTIIGKWDTGATHSYTFGIRSDGKPELAWSTTGGDAVVATCTAATGITDSSKKWIRVTLDVDNGAGGYVVKFWLSDDGITWTQLGDTITGVGTTSIANTDSRVTIGCIATGGAGELLIGSLYRAQIYAGIDGTKVADFDASLLTEPYATYTDPQGNVWTLNRSSTGRKLCVVDRDLLLLGTDDYLEVADSPLLDFGVSSNATLVIAVRHYGVSSGSEVLFSKRADSFSTTPGYNILIAPGTRDIRTSWGDGTNNPGATKSTAFADGVALLIVARRNGSADTIEVITNSAAASAADSNTGSVDTSAALIIGQQSPGNYGQYEFLSGAVFREALSITDIVRLQQEMLA